MESLNESMLNDEETLFKRDPRVNVISKETYERRVEKVFHLLWTTLAKSFGPYGAQTLIYNYPYSHVTKDGFTIMKNLSMDASDQLVDQAIQNMASDICGRLNYTVGDGTTSAVIATYNIYQNYINRKNELKGKMILPRDIMAAFNEVKSSIITILRKMVTSIQSDDPDELYKNIYKVVYISSNGDAQISDYIADLYRELKYPGINCELAADGITKKRLINGYKFDLVLNDKLYINSDDDTMTFNGADVIMFSVKITKEIYDTILVPLNEHSRLRGRKLIVCASVYDETALGQTIRRDLMNEYSKTKDINMVLCTYKAISDHTRTLANDFSMLSNTIIIDRQLRSFIENQLDEGKQINQIFNIDFREDIPNLICCGVNPKTGNLERFNQSNNINQCVVPTDKEWELIDSPIRLGYVGKGSIGLKSSLFTDFTYDKARYEATLKDAKMTMKEMEDKYKKLGTFNIVVNQAQQRYHSLLLKMGIIEVGADSDLSQKMVKDAVDDAIKAAASAFDNGIILGCNVHLIHAITKVLDIYEGYFMTEKVSESKKAMYRTVIHILRDGFIDVYRTVLSNAFDDVALINSSKVSGIPFIEKANAIINETMRKMNFDKNIFETTVRPEYETPKKLLIGVMRILDSMYPDNDYYYLHDVIIWFSILNQKVFDVSTKEFSEDVINSEQTDEEILIATIDLISLLITGNQMLITQKNNF